MIIDPKHLKFVKPVGIKIGGHVSSIWTVEQAIDWIDNQTLQTSLNIREAIKPAKVGLLKANDERSDALAEEGRQLFATALDSVGLLNK